MSNVTDDVRRDLTFGIHPDRFPTQVNAGRVAKFLAQLGQFRGNRSIKVTRLCQQIESAIPVDKPASDKPGAGR